MRVRKLAEWLGAQWEGDGDREIRSVAPLEEAGPEELSFVSSAKAGKQAHSSRAGCLIVFADYENTSGLTVIRSADPRGTIARVILRLHPRREPRRGVDETAVLGSGVVLGDGVSIGPRAVIGSGVRLGDGSIVSAGCVIGEDVRIGEECWLHPNVTIYPDVSIGNGCILHSGCVIGADGFGFVMSGDHWEKFPQVGRVEIGNDVEIGANSCVDRAALGVTSIGDGTKLDNMVHVAHNCRIGRHVVVAAQTGFSGGVVVGDYAVIGGQVGVGDKARIESRAVLGSGSGVLTSKIVRAGEPVWGTPARPLKQYLEQLAAVARLPEIRRELAEIRKKLG